MKIIELQMLLYTLTKKFIEAQRNIQMHTKWCGGLMAKTLVWNQDQGSIPLTNIYYVEYVYLYIYFVHLCKCIVSRWVVYRQVGGHGGWVDRYFLFIYYILYLKIELFLKLNFANPLDQDLEPCFLLGPLSFVAT